MSLKYDGKPGTGKIKDPYKILLGRAARLGWKLRENDGGGRPKKTATFTVSSASVQIVTESAPDTVLYEVAITSLDITAGKQLAFVLDTEHAELGAVGEFIAIFLYSVSNNEREIDPIYFNIVDFD